MESIEFLDVIYGDIKGVHQHRDDGPLDEEETVSASSSMAVEARLRTALPVDARRREHILLGRGLQVKSLWRRRRGYVRCRVGGNRHLPPERVLRRAEPGCAHRGTVRTAGGSRRAAPASRVPQGGAVRLPEASRQGLRFRLDERQAAPSAGLCQHGSMEPTTLCEWWRTPAPSIRWTKSRRSTRCAPSKKRRRIGAPPMCDDEQASRHRGQTQDAVASVNVHRRNRRRAPELVSDGQEVPDGALPGYVQR